MSSSIGLIFLAAAAALPAVAQAAPAAPPAPICGDAGVLDGPASPPQGAMTVPAGDNAGVDFGTPHATYWFAPGIHTLGDGEFSQIAPADGATFVGAPKAVLDGRRINRYAFTMHATGVTIEHLTIRHFGLKRSNIDEGVVNHDAGTGWTIRFNTIRENAGAGVFVGSRNVVDSNCITANGQYGFSMYKPPVRHGSAITDIELTRNEISFNNADDIEHVTGGCGCTGGGKFWDVKGAKVLGNWVHDNRSVGLWADTDDIGFRFEGNLYRRQRRRRHLLRDQLQRGHPGQHLPAQRAGQGTQVAGRQLSHRRDIPIGVRR